MILFGTTFCPHLHRHKGLVFMHWHGIAHLDISLRNILTDFNGHYAFIDFETSRLFPPPCFSGRPSPHDEFAKPPRIQGVHGTEDPPEIENGEESDPFKVDIWALAVVILRACKVRSECLETFFFLSTDGESMQMNSYDIPQIVAFTRPMLDASFERRPTAAQALAVFDRIAPQIIELARRNRLLTRRQ